MRKKLSFENDRVNLAEGDSEAIAVIAVKGFVDSSSCRFFERAMESAHAQNTRFCVVDFADVNYVNSTGISILIRSFGHYRERDGLLALVSVPRSVGLAMHLLGVTSLIPFHEDLEAARAQFLEVVEGKVDLSEGVEKAVIEEGRRRKVYVPLRSGPSPFRNSRILLLTPKPTRFSRVLSLRYQRLNGQFQIFHDSQQALGSIEQDRPDLVFVDSRMDLSGDFVTKLKIHPERSLTSVIKIYPAKANDVRDELNFKIWENDYLVDPFDIVELFSLAEAELLRVPKDRKVFQQQIRFELRTNRENVEKATKLGDLIIRRCLSIEEDRTALYAAIKEGIDNAALHGNGWKEDKTIDVNFLVDRHKITVIIEDEGKGFDFEYYLLRIDEDDAFEKAKKKIVDEGRRGGLGILLMSRCTDRIEYSGSGNILRLEKNLK